MTSYESSLMGKTFVANSSDSGDGSRPLSPPIFVLCEKCYWCATYFDKTKVPKDNNYHECLPKDNNYNNTELTSFPILPNESFTFHYSDKTGVELEFKPRRKYK